MTSEQWQSCTDPRKLTDWLRGSQAARSRAGQRRVRLVGLAACRRVQDHITEPLIRRALDQIEEILDGDDIEAALTPLGEPLRERWRAHLPGLRSTTHLAEDAVIQLTNTGLSGRQIVEFERWSLWRSLNSILYLTSWCAGGGLIEGLSPIDAHVFNRDAEAAEERAQCDLIRDIFGCPTHRVTIDPMWLAWQDRIVPRLAAHITAENRFDEMPILGDALEDAGCTDTMLLEHCHAAEEHVHGCWIVEMLREAA